MARERSMRDDGRKPNASRWIDLGGSGKFKTWQLAGTRFYVKHCGHPTALWPWYGLRPDGTMITSGWLGERGYAFRYLDDAKVATELAHAGELAAISLTEHGRKASARVLRRRARAPRRRG
jgi:hypothetical protein